MSRIGRAPVTIPDKVKVEIKGSDVTVTGPKGTLFRSMHPSMTMTLDNKTFSVTRPSDNAFHRSLHGLTRQLVFNMVKGVSEGFEKSLEIQGVGYRAELIAGKHLKLQVGYSHSILVRAIPGIQVILDDPTHIKIMGIDKELVGMMAAKIRSFRPPEPYKGKGIRYKGEIVRKKAGKTAA
ncbi:MAG: 50S ribosomal protein L6 [Candidatus Zixiibacteriota bacterium]|nr:MAG: 50S ribosomal protein L6 [candidate division Zixibacteria bacterium]